MSDASGSGTAQGGTARNRTPWIIVGVIAVVLVLAAIFLTRSSDVVVPNIVGMTGVEAAKAVQDAGFTIGEATQVETTTVEAGTIVSQTPRAGSKAKKGSGISAVQAVSPKAATVPDVKGQQAEAASATVAGAGFVPVIYDTYDNTVAAGIAVGQVPAAGTQAGAGSEVGILVSKGKEPAQAAPIAVPNVTGKTQVDAQNALKAVGFVPVVYNGASSSVASGKVYGQVPSAGAEAFKGAEVGIFVSTGPTAPAATPPVSVPGVVGKKEADAQNAIAAVGLEPVSYSGYSDTIAMGLVIQQLPAAGSKVDQGTQVGYLVSLGKPGASVKVPNVVGMTAEQAANTLADAGLAIIELQDWSESVPEGQAMAQLPDAGATVAPNSSVAVSVSKGPQPVPTPY
jgi:beta-lactam-binding protein with PASTA domain